MAQFAHSGITLRSRLQSGGLQAAEALAIASETGRALAQAHKLGRIHGNLTTESVRLEKASAPNVTIQGFGEEQPVRGSPDDFAPERVAGGPPTVAADIYSFGRILDQLRRAVTLDPAAD